MSVEQVIKTIEQLTDSEKLTVIRATAGMLQRSATDLPQIDTVAETAPLYRVDEDAAKAERGSASQKGSPVSSHPTLSEVIQELMSRPDPEPEQMLKPGLLKGIVFDEEDFRAAEWHPSEEELENGGLSLCR
ncbi:MAG: hypothetical protein KF753_03410 [Caldilineaceae bacterium]|nr:hypothetical protein [Caldilineaceae bacterium]